MLGLVEALLRNVVVRVMVMKMVEVPRESWVSQVVMEVVVYGGGSHWGEMVLVVMLRGHVGRNRQRWEAQGWGRGERVHMYPSRLPHPSRRRSGRLPYSLRVVQRRIVHMDMRAAC